MIPLSGSDPALSQSRCKLDKKLPMMSPNNSQALLSPRSRHRARNFRRTRHRSFDSVDASGLPVGSKSYNSLNSYRDQSPLMSPSKSNQSFNITDDTPKSLSSFPSRSARSKNSRFPHPRSFDSLELPGLLLSAGSIDRSAKHSKNPTEPSPNGSNHQRKRIDNKGEDNCTNDKATIAEKLDMMAPNNVGRRFRARRSSLDAAIFSMNLHIPSMDSVDTMKQDDIEEDRKENENATPSNSTDQITSQHKGGERSLPSNSDQSHQSAWTEMTVRSDTYLQSNQDGVDSGSTSSAYYSDGGLETSHRSFSARGNDFQDVENDDDSSNPNFDYAARDNGSHKSLSSAFSLNDLGSTGTVSSLSVDGEISDRNLKDFDETPQRQIQIIMSPTRQLRRQQRRTSTHSFGRRRRRFSNGSYASYGSTIRSGDDLTEEEVMTQDSSIPEIPTLPNQVSATEFLMKRSYSGSGEDIVDHTEDVEEITVDDEDGEYFEELLNEASENPDESTKRYEIIISDDSYIEEIVVEVEEEETEITLEEEYLNDTEPVENSHDYRGNQGVETNSECCNKDEAQQESTNDPSDAIEKAEDNDDRRLCPTNQDELESTVDHLDKAVGTLAVDDGADCTVHTVSNEAANDGAPNAQNE